MWKPRLASLLLFAISFAYLRSTMPYSHWLGSSSMLEIAVMVTQLTALCGVALGLFGVLTSFLLVPSGEGYALNTESFLGRALLKIDVLERGDQSGFCFVSFKIGVTLLCSTFVLLILGIVVYLSVLEPLVFLALFAVVLGLVVAMGCTALLYLRTPRLASGLLVVAMIVALYFAPKQELNFDGVLGMSMLFAGVIFVFGLFAYLRHILKKTSWYAQFCPTVTVPRQQEVS